MSKPNAAYNVSPLGALQRQHALEVPRLRKEIEGLGGGEFIAGGEKETQVAHLRGGITRDVDDGTRSKSEELLEKLFVAAFARRIDHDGGVGGDERGIEAGENCG